MSYKRWHQLDWMGKGLVAILTPFAFVWIGITAATTAVHEVAKWWTE